MSGTNGVTRDKTADERQQLMSAIANSALVERIEPRSVVQEIAFTPPSARGSTYRIIVTDEMDPYDRPMPAEAMLATTPALLTAVGDNFGGTKRRAVKISIAQASIQDFADLKGLIDGLPSIQTMVDHHPPLTQVWNSRRAVEEQRNVRLRVWLYAASREDDNDFHLILGRTPGALTKTYMTMELSGLPPANTPHFTRLSAARDAYKQFFGINLPGGTYHHYDPPIPVEIEGSLFFDITHSTGQRPGPQKLRNNMPTIWEVHPISRIVFEP